MNESILKALMRLFAIVANVNKEESVGRARNVVESYLKLQLNKSLVEQYLLLFDEYLEVHNRDINKDNQKARKKTSLNSVKVLMICHEINEVLQQKEKIIVVLRLLEFVGEDEIITEKELEFINTVAETFNIAESEYKNIKDFVLDNVDRMVNKSTIMQIDNTPEVKELDNYEFFFDQQNDLPADKRPIPYKHLYAKNLSGKILVLHIKSINVYIFKYLGDDSLLLNSQPIYPFRTYIFDNGALVKSTKIAPIYYSDIVSKFIHSEQQSKILLVADNIEYRFKNSENGIQKFSFQEESGHLIGIMGGSGVGKSTLLNVLIGNYKLKSGTISINGYDLYTNKNDLKGVIGYVPQDDLLIEELTVFQNLYFNAKLCFGNFSKKRILRRIAQILIDLDLNQIRDLKVGNALNKYISGGQRKRLNIALELIREPSVLVVDEPTSGLSSADSDMVMTLLKEQTLKGKLVLVNIHQPSSDIYKLFDKLIILDRGGTPVYYGNPIDAIVYFKTMSNYVTAQESECPTCGNVNPEQVLELIEAKVVNEYGKLTRNRKISPKEWYSLYNKNIAENNNVATPENKIKLPKNYFKVPSKLKQFVVFTLRNLLTKLTNRQYLLINLLEAPALALILAYFSKFISGSPDNPNLYIFSENENIPAYLFMSVIVALFIGLSVSAEEIIKDRRILQRETFLNLSRISYINSKIAILFLISAVQTISFILVGNYILEIKGLTFNYWIILFSTAAMANLIGLNISSALNSVVTIYITIPFILVPQILFSGVIVSFSKLHKNVSSVEVVPVIGDLMTSRWAYEALAVTQFTNNNFEKHFYTIDKKISEINFITAFLIPDLQTRINQVKKDIKLKQNTNNAYHNLAIIQNELTRLSKITGIPCESLNNVNKLKFNDDVGITTWDYLEKIRVMYEDKLYNANQEKDAVFAKLAKNLGSDEKVYALRKNYHNKNLEQIVLNKNDIDKVVVSKNTLVQMKDPIFKNPLYKNGRAHFYAPLKKVGPFEIPTFWFNTLFIWFTTLVMYIALISDLLRKLIEGFGSTSIVDKFKRILKINHNSYGN